MIDCQLPHRGDSTLINAEGYYKGAESVVSTLSSARETLQGIENYAAANGLKVFWRGSVIVGGLLCHPWVPGTSLKARCLSRGIISIDLLGVRSLQHLPGESESSLRCLSSNRLFG